LAQGLQNEGMHLAVTTLFFRAHTRVLTTLSVALAITCLSLSGAAHPPAATITCNADKMVAKSALPLESARPELPRTVVRLFFLLPHLLPRDN
jgi:hypothetical protein